MRLRSLHRHEVAFVVIGASAAIAQGAPIGTIDLDLGYRRSQENIQRMVDALRGTEKHLVFMTDILKGAVAAVCDRRWRN